MVILPFASYDKGVTNNLLICTVVSNMEVCMPDDGISEQGEKALRIMSIPGLLEPQLQTKGKEECWASDLQSPGQEPSLPFGTVRGKRVPPHFTSST